MPFDVLQIGDVRKSLTQLEKEVNDRFKLMDTLNLLAKITEVRRSTMQKLVAKAALLYICSCRGRWL